MVILQSEWREKGILIHHSERATDLEFVVQDLHIGLEYHLPGDSNATPYKFGQTYELLPGKSIVVYTLERVEVRSKRVFGQLCSKASLAAQGIMVANTKVDPMFDDRLRIPLFNASDQPYSINKGDPFCSIYFMECNGDIARNEVRGAPNWPAQVQRGFLLRAKAHRTEIATILGGAASGALGALVTDFFR
jgi:dUTPase